MTNKPLVGIVYIKNVGTAPSVLAAAKALRWLSESTSWECRLWFLGYSSGLRLRLGGCPVAKRARGFRIGLVALLSTHATCQGGSSSTASLSGTSKTF